MWLYLLGAALVVIGIVGGIATGGIFMLAMIPIGAVVFLSAWGYAMMGRMAERRAGGKTDAHASTARPLPHTSSGESGHVPTSPDALADARRREQ
jgi:4-hydroxybenzoate polyprenyltransferase